MAVSVNKIKVNSLYRAHRAFIFAIARLSCFSISYVFDVELPTNLFVVFVVVDVLSVIKISA